MLDNWRASHAYIINTFQANLRRRARGKDVVVGQRLKRRPTIVDKLSRQPSMRLARMHDIAGCRVIFPDVNLLRDFRDSLHSSRARHELLNGDDDKFNYIEKPKTSGYRGVHDVFKYQVSSPMGEDWNGLRIEIQYRTTCQHAWATAVETADLLTKGRAKFSEGEVAYQKFWQLASEIVARTGEGDFSCLPEMENNALVAEFEGLESELHILRLLEQANEYNPLIKENISGLFPRKNVHNILVYPFADAGGLSIYQFPSLSHAIEQYAKLEETHAERAEVVLVRAEDRESVVRVFQNYFSDTKEFINLIRTGLYRLR